MTDLITALRDRELCHAVVCYDSLRTALVDPDDLSNETLLALAQRASEASEHYARGYADGRWDGIRGQSLCVSATHALPGYGEGYAKGWLDADGTERSKQWPR
jgi:hypothetical protein